MSLEKYFSLDAIDTQILNMLAVDGRISVRQLADKIGMSAPSITERLRRLESRGIVQNYSVNIDLSKLGYTVSAIVRIRPRPGQLKRVEKMIESQPRFIFCDRVTGDDCYIAKLLLRSISELDDLLDPFHDCAETNTSIVKSSLIDSRPVY